MPFEKGQSGNPAGRPRGSRNRRSQLVEKLYDESAAALVQAAIELAIKGDGTALRVCMDRVSAPMKERTVAFELPPMTTAADAIIALGAIAQAVADGDLTPTEAGDLAKLVQGFAQTVSTADLEQRIKRIEELQQAAAGGSD
jgi:hypothetical protein